MNRDGSHCRVGVRHLADISGLDKTTVAQHRALAVQLGWLIGSKPQRGHGSGELYSAAPDDVELTDSNTASDKSGQPRFAPPTVSGLAAATVRNEPAIRPVKADVPSLPVLSLKRKLEGMRREETTERQIYAIDERSLEGFIREMLMTDPRVPHYLHDIRSLANLVPASHRLPGYETVIQRLIGEGASEPAELPKNRNLGSSNEAR